MSLYYQCSVNTFHAVQGRGTYKYIEVVHWEGWAAVHGAVWLRNWEIDPFVPRRVRAGAWQPRADRTLLKSLLQKPMTLGVPKDVSHCQSRAHFRVS